MDLSGLNKKTRQMHCGGVHGDSRAVVAIPVQRRGRLRCLIS